MGDTQDGVGGKENPRLEGLNTKRVTKFCDELFFEEWFHVFFRLILYYSIRPATGGIAGLGHHPKTTRAILQHRAPEQHAIGKVGA
ncbi:hypothetical protein [Massilia glaciei]|uniref:hypothetical protein n=1 Tax=Massilia glaciei TaxID=1524097 RepID=UPI0015E80624|nr:hypothetical protein [Massilia glaciei]